MIPKIGVEIYEKCAACSELVHDIFVKLTFFSGY
jgi:hypothetical protein